jgi:uncharacterized protein YdaU (DUF1376 family)
VANDTHYFPHDTNASGDEKVIHLLSVMDWTGYGIYWGIIEKLHASSDGWMDADYERIAFAMRSQCVLIKQVIEDFGLFNLDGNRFTSDRVLKNLREIKKKSDIGKTNAKARWDKALTKDATAMPLQCQPNAIKERKGKESKVKEKEIWTPPSMNEIAAYCKERGNVVDPQRWHDFYMAKGWMIGKNRMKDWKAAVRTWEKGDENKPLNTWGPAKF